MQIILHSYTFREFPLEDAFKAAKEYGWDGLELSRVHFDPADPTGELPRCKSIADSFGIPIHCFDFSGDFHNDDAGAVEQSLKVIESSITACADNGIVLLNGFAGVLTSGDPQDFGKNGSAIAENKHFEHAAQCLQRVGTVAEDRGVTLTLEIHMNTIHDTVASMARLLDLVDRPNVLANPDPGNMFATPHAERDLEALDRLQGRIGYFHLKNCVSAGDTYDFSVCLDEGEIDVAAYVRKSRDLGYTGPVCIEYCGEDDPLHSVQQDISFMKRCFG